MNGRSIAGQPASKNRDFLALADHGRVGDGPLRIAPGAVTLAMLAESGARVAQLRAAVRAERIRRSALMAALAAQGATLRVIGAAAGVSAKRVSVLVHQHAAARTPGGESPAGNQRPPGAARVITSGYTAPDLPLCAYPQGIKERPVRPNWPLN